MKQETRQYKDVSGDPVSLDWLVKAEPEWAANQIRNRDSLEAELKRSRELIHSMKKALRRGLPWIGKMIADGGHMNSVAPNDAVGSMQRMEAALSAAKTFEFPKESEVEK